jgi:hypothetical protein
MCRGVDAKVIAELMIGINPFSGRCHHKLGVLVWENVCELTPVANI